ncbi:DUF475 domain-containing protein [Paracoccus sp. ME4]|uniref:DUF475 domain-containing protein n=1 Tax=Paracoccus sp. ME4 TaxID=3138066 RepID=UPI00398A6932
MSQRSTLSYFGWSFAVTAIGLVLAAAIGFYYESSMAGALSFLFIAAVLSVLEISLSFDNAIVNANKLKTMTPVWQQRFLTWGILIAVFGMRIVFPVLIVVVAANIGPIEALRLAATDPEGYAAIVGAAHLQIAAFGGTFLMMVALSFFLDGDKEVHWVPGIEALLAKAGGAKGFEVLVTLAVIFTFHSYLEGAEAQTFLMSALWGMITFLAVELVGHLLDAQQEATKAAAQGGFGAFLYLEVLDASFSFDGVIGAFALTQNLFLIAIGLGIGAMYVRSMTIMLVEKGTLGEYRYLEHGAFWSILILSGVMFSASFVHIPEVFTGLFGAVLIGIALWSSIRWNKANPEDEAEPAEAIPVV